MECGRAHFTSNETAVWNRQSCYTLTQGSQQHSTNPSPEVSRNALTTNLIHVTAIQANPEVAIRKLPSIEFFIFYQIKNKSD